MLTSGIEANVYRFLHVQAKQMYVPLFVVGGVDDHLHILAAVRPALSPADFVKQLQGSSSRFISLAFQRPFEWLAGYGVYSVSGTDISRVINYLRRQKEHHRQDTCIADWERLHHCNVGPDGASGIEGPGIEIPG